MCQEMLEYIKTLSDLWLAAMTTFLALFTFGLVKATQRLFVETKDAATRQLGVNTWLHFVAASTHMILELPAGIVPNN
jgi:hypothetical protein